VRRYERINISDGKRGKGRPKKNLDELIREDLKVVELTEDTAQDRRLWRDRIKNIDFRELGSYLPFSCSRVDLVVVFSYFVFICR